MKVGIVGANGYSGIELIRFLLNHRFVTIEVIIANSNSGKNIANLFPHLTNILEEELEQLTIDTVVKRVDLLFFATPSGVSKDWIPQFINRGIKCIDLSGDFRLKEADAYKEWYQFEHSSPSFLQEATYGLVDIFKEKIKNAVLIANPGCYATAILLGLIPCVENNLIDPNTIVIDGKSGVSGAGRKASLATQFSEVNENVKAYKVGKHQHIPEVEQVLSEISGNPINICFTTHLIPMTRGIMCTIYVNRKNRITTKQLLDVYEEYYEASSSIRIRPEGNFPTTKEVYGSNYCDIGLYVDERTNRLTIVSVIDNVVKGAAGQAIQNMNLLNNWDMDEGIRNIPIYP